MEGYDPVGEPEVRLEYRRVTSCPDGHRVEDRTPYCPVCLDPVKSTPRRYVPNPGSA